MTPDVAGDPPRPTHHEILKEEHTRAYHVVDVLLRCQYIMDITLAGIDNKVFTKGSK